MSSNRTTLADLTEMTPTEVAKLPTDQLQMILEDVAVLSARAKSLNDKMDAALDIRFSIRAVETRQADGKDTGRVRFDDGEYEILADLPKSVVWDQKKLASIVETIKTEWREDPADYLTVKYGVAESKYNAWPPPLRKLFDPARTVKAGKPSYEILPKQKEAA